MCGRYYTDDETVREIERLTRKPDERFRTNGRTDIHPADTAMVLMADEQQEIVAAAMEWGFPVQHKGLIINARAETVTQRPMFSDSAARRRCLIPAAGFYEWNQAKEKASFEAGRHSLLLAGVYQRIEGRDRFVIITTAANESAAVVHERMPLIIEERDMRTWLLPDGAYQPLLKQVPAPLHRIQEYEQQSLF